MLFICGALGLVIIINLLVGFATASTNLSTSSSTSSHRRLRQSNGGCGCLCFRHSATNVLIRTMFGVNQLIHFLFLLLLIGFCLLSFVAYLMTTLCNNASHEEYQMATAGNGNGGQFPGATDPAYTAYSASINLQPFTPLLAMFNSSADSQLLLFKDNRLKVLCRDYVSTLTIYTLISLLGVALVFIGFHCYLINLTVNRIKLSTYKKYTELLYLNQSMGGIGGGVGVELNTFNDSSNDYGDRF